MTRERETGNWKTTMPTPVFKRILLKLSGEALAANQGFGVDPLRIHEIAAELADVHSLDIQIAIVVAAGISFAAWPSRRARWIASPPTTIAIWILRE